MNVDMKKNMPLAEIEFKLFKTLIQLEQKFGLVGKKILFNLQVSGGQDSMALLHAFYKVFQTKQASFQGQYEVVVQHFNHKQRGQESEGDELFTYQEALKREFAVTLTSLPEKLSLHSNQELFRNWRKKEAQALCSNLTLKNHYDRAFIVTAHHARDHVETLLQNILRGTGISGLAGLSLLDESQVYLKPFWNTPYLQLCQYVEQHHIAFREDSSNQKDHYTRNYIRHHILPHLNHLNPNYEEAFLKISRHLNKTETNNNCEMAITKETTASELFSLLKNNFGSKNLSENSILNIHHEAQLLLKNKQNNLQKIINTKIGNLTLTKTENCVLISSTLNNLKCSHEQNSIE